MKNKQKIWISLLLAVVLSMSIFSGCGNNQDNQNQTEEEIVTSGPTAKIQILATSDMHDYLMNYDYYTSADSDNYGLVKLATLIKDIRNQNGISNNVVLVDNGDLIQGNPLGDYFARVNPVKSGEVHPIYKALEALGYDAAGLGNHEFNYGLEFLHQIINDTQIPVINANVYNEATGENEFRPYVILNKSFDDGEGALQEIKVGIISFVPTQILNWDKLNLEGKVTVQDIRACAEHFVPIMKQEGADIIVALAHTGYGTDGDYVEGAENMAYHLTLIDDIDVVIGGHSHEMFPSEDFVKDTGYQNVDIAKGTINGKFTVQPAKYAEGLGCVTLQLAKEGDTYQVVDGNATVLSAVGVPNDQELEAILLPYHKQVIDYVNGPVGELANPINSFFALVGDDASVQIISDAQLQYAKEAVNSASELLPYKDLPILSAAAPFKAGLSKSGTNAEDYVDIAAGNIAIKDVASLYKYPNTLAILKLRGVDIREWLEMSSGIYNTIVPNATEPQELLNGDFPAFNFDTIDGVTYEVDITQLPRYSPEGDLVNEETHRIINLNYNGAPLKDEDEFLVVTNNYRAGGGGNFPIFTGDQTPLVYSSSDEVRQILSDYIAKQGTITPKADGNWKLAPIDANVLVTFISSSKGETLLSNYPYIELQEDLGNGLAQYIYVFNMNK
nr:bifunctional 2',3'-cyclic-nucleotide 2'-phosphodiesterase/3'-nucleotidase [uncultured Cellulosilyticum sp.]